MQVRVAGTAGFCWGVQRALRLLDEARDGKRMATLGPLVHSGPVLQRLLEQSVGAIPSAEQAGPGDLVALRPHGATETDRAGIAARGAKVLDLTCPHVADTRKKILELAERGVNIVIAGNREHDEVRVLLDGIQVRTWTVASGDEARTLAAEPPFALVCQSTFGPALLEDVEETLRERFDSFEVHATRCGATEDRQDETIRLAAEADVLVVVGPYHSGNARRLAEMGRDSGKQTFHVEGPEDVPVPSLVEQARLSRRQSLMERFADDPDRLREATADVAALDREVVIGVTAGASTPPWSVRAVVDHIVAATKAELREGLPRDLAAAAEARKLSEPPAPAEAPAKAPRAKKKKKK
jgi:4-hydroxy-3-methylbut-2-enyl diphosphate reductase